MTRRGYDWDAIRSSYPLREVLGRALKVTKVAGWYEALCPFHDERTPSLKFREADEHWHCFGCGKRGDVIDFVSEFEHVSKPEAIARLTGGQAVEFSEEDRRRRDEWLKAEAVKEESRQAAAIELARRRWDRATPVDGASNAYLERKQVAPFNIRAEGASLLIPMWDAEGDLINVQAIPPEEGGRKLFHTGCPTVGARFYIGGAFSSRLFICEGFATGATVFDATVDHVCVAFSQGQVANIAREMMAAGRDVVIAADRKALDVMTRLGAELGVPVIAPPATLEKGDDFNDLMVESGIEAVAATIRQGLVDFANRPPPPPAPPECAISFVDAMDFVEGEIPVRPWLVPGALLAGSTHILAAPGGTGKSVFTLQMALMLATGEAWARWQPKRKCRVLVINAEDDINEQRRRIAGAKTAMGLTTDQLRGQIIIADNPDSIVMATTDDKRKAQVATPLVAQLVDVIRHHQIDVVVVDPFAETFDGDENSNGDTKWAMKIWRDQIARPTGCAVYLVHHTTKGSEDKAGSADVIRGGGAIVNSARLAATLFVMTPGEAETMQVKPDQRFRYVRFDDAKSNNSLIGGRKWFEKVSVMLQNGPAGDSEGGDEVGALMPWNPPGLGAYEPAVLMKLLQAIEDGYVDEDGVATDVPFGRSAAGKSKRWVGHLMADMMSADDIEARKLITLLEDAKIISEVDFHDHSKGRAAKGLKVDMDAARTALGLSPNS